jgi:hypothetical protein
VGNGGMRHPGWDARVCAGEALAGGRRTVQAHSSFLEPGVERQRFVPNGDTNYLFYFAGVKRGSGEC